MSESIAKEMRKDYWFEYSDGKGFVAIPKGAIVFWNEEQEGWFQKDFPDQFWYLDESYLKETNIRYFAQEKESLVDYIKRVTNATKAFQIESDEIAIYYQSSMLVKNTSDVMIVRYNFVQNLITQVEFGTMPHRDMMNLVMAQDSVKRNEWIQDFDCIDAEWVDISELPK